MTILDIMLNQISKTKVQKNIVQTKQKAKGIHDICARENKLLNLKHNDNN